MWPAFPEMLQLAWFSSDLIFGWHFGCAAALFSTDVELVFVLVLFFRWFIFWSNCHGGSL